MKQRCLRPLFALLFLFPVSSFAQFCGGGVTDPVLLQKGASYNLWSSERSATITYVKLKVQIASQPGPGGDAATMQDFQQALDLANQAVLPGNIQFVVCGGPTIVDDMSLYYFNNIPSINPIHEYGYLNVTIVKYIQTPSGVSGLAMMDHAIVSASALNSEVLAHELGHVLGLAHTHETGYGAELVNGSNCATAGDLICDTPADPNLGISGNVDYQTCNYTGTATDANNQPYAPMVNNIMSYAPWNCQNAFTPGQFNVMHYTLDSLRPYWRKPVTPVLITPFPAIVCTYASDILLSATPTGGTFSGAQVSGTTLDPQNGPAGNYSVNYQPANAPEPSQTYVDQYWNIKDFADTSNDIWQSFKTYETGTFTAFDFYIRNISTQPYTFKLFQGTGTAGTLLFSAGGSMPAMANAGWVQFPIGITLNPAPGTIYTAELLIGGAGFECYVSSVGSMTWDYDYQQGQSNYTGFFAKDYGFREWIQGVPGCQDETRYYKVYAAPDAHLLNVAALYCTSDDSIVLKNDTRLPSATYIDGVRDSLLIPADLSPGLHSVLLTSVSLGCVDSALYSVYAGNGTASFLNLPNPACLNSPPFNLQVDAPGGTILVDSAATSVFDAALLGPGMHYLDYSNTAFHDTIDYSEQECCTGNFAYTLYHPVADSLYWQSFRAQQSGILDSITVLYYSPASALTFETKLYSGIGISGNVLLQDTITFGVNNSGWFQQSLFPGLAQIQIAEDSDYTFSMHRLPDAITDNNIYFSVRGTDPYPNGNSNAGATPQQKDFEFKEILRQITGCDLTASDSVVVDVCTGIATATTSNGFSVFPNPSSEAITVIPAGTGTFELFGLNGQLLLREQLSTTAAISIAEFAAGSYFIRFTGENGNVVNSKIVIVR